MKRLLLLSALFLFQGCSLNQLFLSDEIDSVNIVKYTALTKEHRAYFTREGLRPVVHNQKYLFLYHPKYKHLYVLFHRGHTYLLYNLSVPNRKPRTLTASSGKQLLHRLYRAGYQRPRDLKALGFTVKTGMRRYKGVKTIMIDVKERRISQNTQKKEPESEENAPVDEQTSEGQPDMIEPLYPYYLHQATLTELETYLQSPRAKTELTYGEATMLQHRLADLKKKRFLKEAPLEELIAEYKKNKDPEFKKHIQSRIKELQEQ